MATSSKEIPEGARRELASRQQPWAQAAARRVDRMGWTPNGISLLSLFFATLAGGCLLATAWYPTALGITWLMVGGILGIQGRLICNLLDGMVAIEGGKKSNVGGLYNEIPDRVADPLILACAGYVGGIQLEWNQLPVGWIAAIFSVFTAYLRVLGGSLGTVQSFMGPMAKQHRMALLTLTCLVVAVGVWFVDSPHVWAQQILTYLLLAMILGCAITSVRRMRHIALQLNSSSNERS